MSRSWRNNSINSSGFIYFDTNNSYQNADTSDFMSFNNSPSYGSPKCNRFSPVHYSSPNKFQQSPRNFHGRQAGGRNNFRYHNSRDNNSFNSPNNRSFSSSFNNSRKSGHQHTKNNTRFNNNGKRDMSRYLDHTCTKDPWADLEQKLKKTQESEVKINPNDNNKDGNEAEDSSSSSADEQESESETKTSSSEVEDGAT